MITGLVIFTFSVFAFGMSGIVGGGASLLLIPLLTQVLPIVEVPSALVIGTFTSSLTRAFALQRKIRWNMVVLFVPAAVPSVVLGAWLLRYVDPLIINWVCSLFLLSNIPFLLRKRGANDKPGNAFRAPHVIGIGFLAGLISGITGAVGLLFNSYYLNSGLEKEEIVATRAMNELLLHLLKLIMYFRFGLFSLGSLGAGALVAVAAVLSAFVMRALLPRLSELTFRKAGYAAMTAAGLLLLTQTTMRIAEEKKPSIMLATVGDGWETNVRWQQSTIVLEVGYDGEISLEQVISTTQVPSALRPTVHRLAAGADHLKIECVYRWRQSYYELYVEKAGITTKYEIRRAEQRVEVHTAFRTAIGTRGEYL